MAAEPAKQPAELNTGQPEKQGENSASSDSRAFEDCSVFPACRIGAGFGDNNLQPTANLEQSSLASIAALSSPVNAHVG